MNSSLRIIYDSKFESIINDFQKFQECLLRMLKKLNFKFARKLFSSRKNKSNPLFGDSAEKLVRDIDPKDTPYVAFSKQFRCKIWNYDKVLRKGLEKNGFRSFISTDKLYRLRGTLS